MPEPIQSAALNAASYIFETAAFMSVLPCDGEAPPTGLEPEVSATVAFHGPLDGLVTVRVASRMLAPLTANMLGLCDTAESGEQGQDALKEVANMVCGNFLSLWQGDSVRFTLSPPQIRTAGGVTPPEQPVTAHVFFQLEDSVGQVIVEELAVAAGDAAYD